MATGYPAALDNYTNPAGSDVLDVVDHAGLHADAFDAIEAVEGELGINPSGAAATVAARFTALDTTVSGKETAGAATSAVSAHVAATDPHGDRAFATSAVAALSSVYQPLDSDLTAIAALSTTSFGRALLTQADAAATRTTLGLGTAATTASSAYEVAGAAAAAQAASQPLDSDLTAIAALTTTSYGRAFLALADAAAARTALALGTLSTVTPTGTPDGTKFLRDDGAWTATAGGASFPLANTAAAGTTQQYGTKVTADSVDRFTIDAAGKHSWGPGSGAADSTLARTGAAELTAVDQLVAKTFKATGSTGTNAAARFAGANNGPPASGTWAVGDVVIGTAGTVCICTGAGTPGTWVQIARGAVASTFAPGSAVSNTVTETNLLGSFASTPTVVGSGLFAQAWGTVLNNTGSTQTVRFRVKLASNFYLDTGNISLTTSATVRPFLVSIWAYPNTTMNGRVEVGAPIATGTMSAPASTLVGVGTGADTLAGALLNVMVTHGAASASLTTTATGSVVIGY